MATTLAPGSIPVSSARRLSWRHPEWPWALLAGCAWIVLVFEELRPEARAPMAGPAMNHPPGRAVTTAHALVTMLGVTALVTWERLARVPRLRVGALLLAAAAAIMLAVAL